MTYSCQPISLHDILITDDWTLHPWECGHISANLEKSLIEVGILHPPIILCNGNESTYSVLHGYKRLFWAKNQGDIDSVDCIIVPSDTNPLLILDILLTDHLNGTGISLAEKARFLVLASRFMEEESIRSKYFQPLQLKKNSKISHFQTMLEQSEIIIKEIHDGRLQEKMIFELLKIQRVEERLTIVQLFKDLGLGDGKQKRLFTLIRDLAFRGNLSITDFLNKTAIQSILHHQEMNTPQKAQNLASYLQNQLTPKYNTYLDEFEKQRKELQLPSNYSIAHVPAFEKDEVTLAITFKDFAECKAHVAKIIKDLQTIS